jgi:hypothetical protein
MAPWKMEKNPDAAGEDSNPNADILSDTTPRATDTIKTWTQVFEILEHEIINCPEDSTEEEDDSYAANLRHIAQSELHKIVARPRIMPYNDMISWALEHVDIQTRSIINHQQVSIGSFRPEHLQVMYKLSPTPKYTYNVAFILEFERKECVQYARSGHDIIKTWWGHPEKFRTDAHGMYATMSLDAHMVYVAMMLCRLFGKKIPTHFSVEWVSIMNEVAEGYTFNWAKMLSDNLAKEIVDYKTMKSKGQPTPFYMSAYVMDAICFMTPFPLMNWSWTPASSEPIHFYHSKLWEEKAKDLFYEICHNVIVPVHIAIYGHPPPRISERIMGNLGKLADWFIEENFSYIRVFGCSVPPHALPQFLPDRLVCREVVYQIVVGGINKELKEAQKKVWMTFPIQVGMFTLLDFGHSKVEAVALEDVKLVDIEFKKHDPHKIVENHMAQFNMKWYMHENSLYDEIFRGVRSYEEVQNRFLTLPPDQQVGFLSFQKHRRNSLPKILQGESIAKPPSQEAKSTGSESSSSTKPKAEKVPKIPEVLFQEIRTSLSGTK